MSISMAVGNRIRETGRSFSWVARQVKELDSMTGLTEKKLSLSARGQRSLTVDEFLNICKVLDVKPDEFFVEFRESA
ncbi:hypothetical protein FACS1894208_01470 [Clostridia bacterium]|nr:hypothetical protein FACS1894208_01470 [Clostridia bacterium]